MDKEKSSIDTLLMFILFGVLGIFLAAFSVFMEPYQKPLLKFINNFGVIYQIILFLIDILLCFCYFRSKSIIDKQSLMKMIKLLTLFSIMNMIGIYMINYVFV